ncbi:fimbrial protein [Pseudocitrobacter faecalis]|uniref:Type 1 fimbria pilin n=1 Tax=Pseudocitrobacter faecalis TaxID=1398493 RepID=A0ABX9FR76_9ENTR|nr:fimbrial protein [Pseudocitrobacter faecalis]RBP08464.1 type 1 fimbria pilin [Pseudocitrobacter faecalis]UYW73713.1 fimbrial protein [Pseudocitrobacter faecalis]GHD96052.1 fimbrial protein [Pseudocitrobacter faecalis]
MNSGKKTLLALAISVLASGYALADDIDGGGGKITFTGLVISAPCSIKADDIDKKVDLGEVTDTFINANTHSEAKDSSITLENCALPSSDDGKGQPLSKVKVTFTSSNVVASNPGLLSNTFAGGASNVGVRLMDSTGANITLGTAKELALNPDSATQILPFQAWMEKIGANTVTAGGVTATANYTLIYN